MTTVIKLICAALFSTLLVPVFGQETSSPCTDEVFTIAESVARLKDSHKFQKELKKLRLENHEDEDIALDFIVDCTGTVTEAAITGREETDKYSQIIAVLRESIWTPGKFRGGSINMKLKAYLRIRKGRVSE
jgi:hypothetical protein